MFIVHCQIIGGSLSISAFPEKAAKIHPAELVTLCHRFVTPSFLAEKMALNGKFPDFPKTSFLSKFSVFGQVQGPDTPTCRACHPFVTPLTRQPAELPKSAFFSAKSLGPHTPTCQACHPLSPLAFGPKKDTKRPKASRAQNHGNIESIAMHEWGNIGSLRGKSSSRDSSPRPGCCRDGA